MARGRRWLILTSVLVLALVIAGVVRRNQLVDERARTRTERVQALHDLRAVRIGLRTASRAAGAAEADNAATRTLTATLVASAEDLAGQIRLVEQDRNSAVIAALVANGQVGRMRECLDGINRALNQVSVGDANSVRTLETVRMACRAVGA